MNGMTGGKFCCIYRYLTRKLIDNPFKGLDSPKNELLFQIQEIKQVTVKVTNVLLMETLQTEEMKSAANIIEKI